MQIFAKRYVWARARVCVCVRCSCQVNDKSDRRDNTEENRFFYCFSAKQDKAKLKYQRQH